MVAVTAENAEAVALRGRLRGRRHDRRRGLPTSSAEVDLSGQVERMKVESQSGFDQDSIDEGLALNAAVILPDPDQLEETMAAIRAASERVGPRRFR